MNTIAKDDWQYIIIFLLLVFTYIYSDIFNLINKLNFSYYSGVLLSQPYRILTSHFIHHDFSHLLSNIFGIVVSRYFLKGLNSKKVFTFIMIIFVLIPLQPLICYMLDIYLFDNKLSISYGFSGIIFGLESFILLSSILGKEKIFNYNICLKKNRSITRTCLAIISMGFIYSLLPNISFIGHSTGFISGIITFLL